MKKILLLGSRFSGEKNDVSLMQNALAPQLGKEMILNKIYFEDLLLQISRREQRVIDTASGLDIKDADLVIAVNWYQNGTRRIYRDVAFAISLYLRHHNVKFWNSEMVLQRSVSKLSAMMQLGLNGIDVPATTFALSPDILCAQEITFPAVVKDVAASRGKNNYLAQDFSTLKKILADQETNKYIVQEFIANDHDLRVICFAGRPAMIIKRTGRNAATHLNNISQGAEAEALSIESLPKELLEKCEFVCTLMGRELAGIDILPATDGSKRFVFLEVNAIPQLTSGALVQDKLQMLAQSITNHMAR